MQPRLGHGSGDVGGSDGDGAGCRVVESKLHHDGLRVLLVRAYDPTDIQLSEGVDGSLIGRSRARARGDGGGASDQPMGTWREERRVEGGEGGGVKGEKKQPHGRGGDGKGGGSG